MMYNLFYVFKLRAKLNFYIKLIVFLHGDVPTKKKKIEELNEQENRLRAKVLKIEVQIEESHCNLSF